jgi:hypothetical protein
LIGESVALALWQKFGVVDDIAPVSIDVVRDALNCHAVVFLLGVDVLVTHGIISGGGGGGG